LIDGPTKNSYKPTETFDPSGIKILATWNNGDTKEISWGDSKLHTNYTKHIFTPKDISNYIPVTIEYEITSSEYQQCTCYIECVDYTSDITTCSWSELNYWTTWLENGVVDNEKFYKHFTNGAKTLTSMDDLLGIERTIRWMV